MLFLFHTILKNTNHDKKSNYAFAIYRCSNQEIIYLYGTKEITLVDPQNNFSSHQGIGLSLIIMMAVSAGASVFLKGTNLTQILCLVVGAAFSCFLF